MILAPGLPQLPAYTEASLMIWTRGLANGAHEGSPPDSGPGPQPAPGLHRGFAHDLDPRAGQRRARRLPS